ncbi:MAG TPA: hypothetical protein VMT42_06270 [candidate division Zixibacteria bacterium]|nr:hypothetical protein [candidate division Zixibacteria bacterium]
MDWSTILLGAVIALGWIFIKSELGQKTQPRSAHTGTTSMVPTFPGIPYPPHYSTVHPTVHPTFQPTFQPTPPPTLPRVFSTRQPLRMRVGDEVVSTKALVETWKESIVGLIRLAQINLSRAEQWMDRGDYTAAVEYALISTENISRALLHCYGEKPETSSGQGEALELLVRRFTGKESAELEKAVKEISRLNESRVAQGDSTTPKMDHSFTFTRAIARPTIDSASRIVNLFSHIIDENFAAEIPELRETCPKCHSMEVGVMSFNETAVSYTCQRCRHSWIEPR